MRSRYCAFVQGDEAYLLKTWHAMSRPASLNLGANTRWLGLKVLRVERGGADDDEGIVEFVARFKVDGRAHRLREASRFVRSAEGWQYVDGVLHGSEPGGA